MTTPDGFDELIHAPTRLPIVAILAAAEYAEFRYLRDELRLSDSALSKQLTTLEHRGYVDITKGQVGRRPRTVVRLNRKGRDAFARHVAALREIVDPAAATTDFRLADPRDTTTGSEPPGGVPLIRSSLGEDVPPMDLARPGSRGRQG